MKKILFLIIFIFCTKLVAQSMVSGNSTYRFTVTGRVNFSGSTCGDNIKGGLQWIALKKENNTYVTVVQGSDSYPNIGHGLKDSDFSGSHEFTKNNKVTQILYKTTHRNNGFFGCKSTDYADNQHGINICDEINYNFSGLNQPGYSTEKIVPIVTLDTPTSNNSIISSDENLTITLPDNIDNQYYNWEYSVGDVNNFIPFPSQFNNVPILNLKGKDFLADADFGKTIYIRVNLGACSIASPSTSNVIAFTYYKSAPHISLSNITPNLCSYGETGTATLNFDRTLLSGEALKISLVNTDTGAAVLNQDISTDLQTSTTYTLQNLPPGKYKLDLLGNYNGNATYTDSSTHTIRFEITKPTPVTFDSPSKTDVYCFQGNDGVINLTANGGQNQYQYLVTKDGQAFLDWTNFNNGNNTSLQNLSAGVYKIKVRDSNQCIAKDPANSSVEKEITVAITQPAKAIELPTSDLEIVQPTGYGLSNGYISVRVTGGTPKTDGSYDFEWRKDTPNGAVISTGITTDVTNNPYTIKLSNLPAGNYYLTVKDKNYTSATSQLGNCGIISQEFIVSQPKPLVATIEIGKQISCNVANDYAYKIDLDNNGVPDEAEDGNLKVLATGGVGAYSYQWQILNGGVFQNIPGETQPVLSNRSVGTYKVLVHDVNNNTADAEYTFVYPPQLAITMSANTISCYNQNTGMVSVNATGGTGSLSYAWNTSDTTPTVTGLPGGNYFVLVTDSKNCKVKGNVQVIQPDQLIITDASVQNPVCFGASNGEIKTIVSGGKAPYSVSWSNGKTGTDNLGISAGTYTVTVTDANGCSLSKQYTLTDPEQLTVDLGKDITLCLGDTQTYNVVINDAGATYQWKDQSGNVISTSSSITLSNAGTYTVLITDSKGCVATDSVTIKNSSEVLNPQFLLTTHAYKEASVILVNTSPTQPETIEWIIPNSTGIQTINKNNDYLELKFSNTGSYEIGLKGTQGKCEKVFYKTVVVEETTSGIDLNPAKATNITEFTILPNPNNGAFQILVGLETEKPIKLRIIDMVSHEVFPEVSQLKSTHFVVPFSTSLPAGTYLVILETGGEAMVKRMIVK